MKTGALTAVILAAFLTAGCSQELSLLPDGAGMRTVKILLMPECGTYGTPGQKSAVGDALMSDDAIYDVNMAIYDSRGMLVSSSYHESAGDIFAELDSDGAYTIFITANTGPLQPPLTASRMRDLRYRMSEIADMCSSGGLPMSGTADIGSGTMGENVPITLERLAAETVLSFSHDEDLSVQLTAVEYRNVPMDVALFDGNSVPQSRGTGDYASSQDIGLLMSDGQVRFYMLEDMSSTNDIPPVTGHPGTGPMPDDVPYVNIKGRIVNSAGLVTADVDYRLVLDWKLLRNRRYEITFRATETGIYEDSYRVDVSNAALELSDRRLSIPVGGTAVLGVPAAGYADVTFSPGNSSIVSVDGQGRITGLSAGQTQVTVTCPALGATAECQVEVYPVEPFTEFKASLSEYAAGWGTITFSTATADDPVYLTVGDYTFAVGAPLQNGRDMAFKDSGHRGFHYVPSYDPRTVYVQNSSRTGSDEIHFRQGRKAGSLVLEEASYPQYYIEGDDRNLLRVGDNGAKVYFNLYLSGIGERGYLDTKQFMVPEPVADASGISDYEELYLAYLDCLELYSNDMDVDDAVKFVHISTGWEDGGEDYLIVGGISMLRSDETVPDRFEIVFRNGATGYSSMPETVVTMEVQKTFSNQGYLGEVYNYQIAPGELQSSRVEVPMSMPSNAQWEIRRYYPDDCEGMSLAEIWENASDTHTGLIRPEREITTAKNCLFFDSPSQTRQDEFFPNGSYVFRGSVVNPESGQVISGYYAVDIVLYVSVISQVDITMTGTNSSRVGRSYVPLSQWSYDGWSRLWDSMYSVPIYDYATGRKCYLDVFSSGSHAAYFTIPQGIRDPQGSYSITVKALEGAFGNPHGRFDFYAPDGSRSGSLKIDRNNYAQAGAYGYYHFVRQYDAGDSIENFVIEAYYKDFDRY